MIVLLILYRRILTLANLVLQNGVNNVLGIINCSLDLFFFDEMLIRSLTDRVRVVQNHRPTEPNRKLQSQILEQIDELSIREEAY